MSTIERTEETESIGTDETFDDLLLELVEATEAHAKAPEGPRKAATRQAFNAAEKALVAYLDLCLARRIAEGIAKAMATVS